MHVTILGKRWEFLWVKRFACRRQTGECDAPDTHKKAIRIKEGQSEIDELDTICHEVLHAAHFRLDEEFVHQFGTDLARILFKLGYRRRNDGTAD